GVRLGQVEEHEVVEARQVRGDLAAAREVERRAQLGDDRLRAAEALAEPPQVAGRERLAGQAEKLETPLEDEEEQPLAIDDRHLGRRVALSVLLRPHHFPSPTPYLPAPWIAESTKPLWLWRPLTRVSSAANCWTRLSWNASTRRWPASTSSWSERIWSSSEVVCFASRPPAPVASPMTEARSFATP